MINEHKAIDESNDVSNDGHHDDTDRAEWKIQLLMQNSGISTKNVEETCAIDSKSEPVESFMGSDTEDVTDALFNTLYKDFNMHKKHQMIKEANLFLKVLNYCIAIFIK